MLQSITLSYHFLPHHIKPCFLYLGLFPVDFEFSSKKLVKLWISEDFIKEIEGKMEEDTAQKCLEELTERCMIQEATKRYDGRSKTYRIHDIFRQMCIREAQEYGFFEILVADETTPSPFSTSACRLAVHKTSDWYGSPVTSSLRSIFYFSGCTIHDLSKLLSTSVDVVQLKVLHLEGSHIHERALPENIGGARQLRYLNLRGTGIQSLPLSIANLVMLEFLDLRDNHISPIPTAFQKLTRLKELHMDSDTTCMDGDRSLDVSSLSQLRTLSIRAGSWMKDGVPGKLGHLKNFRLYGDLGLCPNELPKYLSELTNLQFLRLGIGFGGKIPNLLGSSLLDRSLHSLELRRSLGKLPDPAEFPYNANLTYLCLKWSQLKHDPMPALEQLPNLRVLRLLCGSFLGTKMVCSKRGFRNLQILELAILIELEEWMVEEMAMPVLKRLVVNSCDRLKMLPQGLHHLEELEELEVSGMPKTFNDRLERTKGEDWKKIQHVKSITVDEIKMTVPL